MMPCLNLLTIANNAYLLPQPPATTFYSEQWSNTQPHTCRRAKCNAATTALHHGLDSRLEDMKTAHEIELYHLLKLCVMHAQGWVYRIKPIHAYNTRMGTQTITSLCRCLAAGALCHLKPTLNPRITPNLCDGSRVCRLEQHAPHTVGNTINAPPCMLDCLLDALLHLLIVEHIHMLRQHGCACWEALDQGV